MSMRIGIGVSTAGQRFTEAADLLGDYEQAGAEVVFVPELYGFDGVSRLGYVAARTRHAAIAAGILQLYTRTPTLLAMSAAGLDEVSGGRFELGIGTSGPQVIEGFHGVPFDAPIGRTREYIEICRQVWRREPVSYQGRYYTVPLPPGEGTGLGKPLKLIDHPVRADIPITIAAIGPRNVELAAELAQAWQPPFYLPEKAHDAWDEPIRAGLARRDPVLGPLGLNVGVSLAIGDDVHGLHDLGRPQRALYIGGMGARTRNFYNDLACRFGYPDAARTIQDLYLSGRKKQAEAAVPEDLLVKTSLIGPEGHVRDRLAALAESGVTTLTVRPIAPDHAGRLRLVEQVGKLLGQL
jgi:F420-dependent oxidoreductase-like protein